ncbi:MAG: CocE/NonD family hydrolase [Acidobacteria bacterium]|nr:CocE/NonD family hydrolase [Acidobacteriota bacterium]MCA1651211.1 CocE/NonD family hydrolase [Acidobacteriota bacterium]
MPGSRTSRFITMRDGVRLAADIHLPLGLEPSTRLPAILEQTRYHRSIEPRPEFREALGKPSKKFVEFVTRGYAYVVVDVRGTGASFGSRRMELMPEEVRDGKEVVDWIIKQTWSDGKVGATGVSYVGTTAELLLVNTHPAVTAVAPQFSLFDSYTDIVFPGGVHMTWFTRVWGQAVYNMDRNLFTEQARERVIGIRPVDEDADRRLLVEAISAHAPNADVHKEISAITFRDDRGPSGWTFDEISPHAYVPKLKASGAAIYSYSRWYDGAYAPSAITRFLTVRNRGSRLVIGPWSHGGTFYLSPSSGSRRSSFDHTQELRPIPGSAGARCLVGAGVCALGPGSHASALVSKERSRGEWRRLTETSGNPTGSPRESCAARPASVSGSDGRRRRGCR